jgi:hypothetical protein
VSPRLPTTCLTRISHQDMWRGGGEAGDCKARDEGPRRRIGRYVEEDEEKKRSRRPFIRRRSRILVRNPGRPTGRRARILTASFRSFSLSFVISVWG